MKKIITILLILVLTLSFVACMSNDSAKQIKQDYQSYDWENSLEAQKVMKANELIMRIDALPSSEQQELTEIKVELERISKGNVNVSPSPNPSESPLPSTSPMVTVSPDPNL